MQGAPSDYLLLRDVIGRRFDHLAPGQGRVARLILDDPEAVAFRSIREIASLASVSQSSLVRFAQQFGYQGYPPMVEVCRSYILRKANLADRLTQRGGEPGEAGGGLGELSTAVQLDGRNLAATFERISSQEWDRAVAFLAQASTIHVIGVRKCLPVAQLFSYLVSMVHPQVQLMAPIEGGMVENVSRLAPGDVLVAISMWRYSKATVTAVRYAAQRGVNVIAFTDNPSSPLVPLAEVSFYVESASNHVLRSITGYISLAQALAAALTRELGPQAQQALEGADSLLQLFEVYDVDSSG